MQQQSLSYATQQDVTQIVPLLPVTFTTGVFPFFAQVVPNNAVSFTPLSS